MKILALCDNLLDIIRFESSFASGQINYLICNNSRKKNIPTILNQIILLPKFRIKEIYTIFNLYLKGFINFVNKDINSNIAVGWIIKNNFDIGLHSMGVIYKKSLINSFNIGILNSHIGKLPEMRGRCVFEWSLTNDTPTGVTCFFIDAGIDTGSRIVLFSPQKVDKDLNISKNKLFQLDVFIYKTAIDLINSGCQFTPNNISLGLRYYVMSNLFKSALNDCMKDNDSNV
jgi:hypothetical protein